MKSDEQTKGKTIVNQTNVEEKFIYTITTTLARLMDGWCGEKTARHPQKITYIMNIRNNFLI